MQWNLERLSCPLENGAGQNLRYEPIYDKIRDARIEEDSSLSRGVWDRELKKADWGQVYSLCTEALEESTKDLQLIGWLCESMCHIERWTGLQKSFELAYNFCDKCWDCFYPEKDVDVEYRIRLLDWFIAKMAERSLFMPFAEPNGLLSQPLDLSMWLSAQNFDLISRRASVNSSKIQEAENSGQMTLKRFRTLIKQAGVDDLQNVLEVAHRVSDQSFAFSNFLSQKFGAHSPSFKLLNERLRSVDQICKFSLDGRAPSLMPKQLPPSANVNDNNRGQTLMQDDRKEDSERMQDILSFSDIEAKVRIDALQLSEPEAGNSKVESNSNTEAPQSKPADDEVTISTRLDAYRAVGDLADYLIEVDPQSPGPYLIKMVSSWGEKLLPSILDDVVEGKSAGHKVLRMLSDIMRRGGV
ncbi:MAG: type VI secretion system ImpA family N-terminal domain-containing protein [Holosporales bacterium]|jgi:type VI secretion system protein ImpA|nr:type VI secretion system ImpA family N-terminal domain-containing protein [Holosporales bacterium]